MDANLCLNVLQTAGNFTAKQLVDFTKVINDVVGSTNVDKFMDAAAGYGHRIAHGHSAEFLPEIYEKFGFSGLVDASTHWLRDLCTPHGVPIPFAKNVAAYFDIAPKTSIEWLCLNVGDVFSGALSALHTTHNIYALKSAVASSHLPPLLAANILIGSIIKITTGGMTHNPITILCGITDAGTLVWALQPVLTYGISYFKTVPALSTAATLESAAYGSVAGLISGVVVSKLFEMQRPSYSKKTKVNAAIGAFVGGISALAMVPLEQSKSAKLLASSISAATIVAIKESVKLRNQKASMATINYLPEFMLNSLRS